MHDIMTRTSTKIVQGKESITALALDQQGEMLWYGTSSSNMNCMKVPQNLQKNIDHDHRDSVVSWKFPDGTEENKFDDDEERKVPSKPDFYVPGEPRVIEYHMMNNRRFVLTRDENEDVVLWQLDTLQLVKKFVR